MTDLYSFFVQRRTTKPMHKWHHYFEVYERHFGPLRARNPTLLEIGVQGGGSLAMWRDYFGPAARIYGIDTAPDAKQNEDVATRVFIGNQGDRDFLRGVRQQIGVADIVIDDGGHVASQQIASFEEFYPMLSETNDLPNGQTFMTFAAARCAELMDWTGKPQNFQVMMTDQNGQLADKASPFCRMTKAISFYDSIVVFERGRRTVPRHEKL
jgi:hypothetical protein